MGAALRRVTPRSVVVSLGTNDGPDPARFRHRIRVLLRTVPAAACVAWATIRRPPRKGPFRALNRVLRAQSGREPRLVLVEWERAVARGRVRLPDRLHPDRAGYLLRSRLVAPAVRRGCPAQDQRP